jgi:ankyrin repeat protein
MYGLTAPHYAAYHGQPPIVKTLIDHGANVVAQDNDGHLPIRRHEVVEVMSSPMEAARENSRLQYVLMGDLLAAALEIAPDVHRVLKLEALHLPNTCLL